MFKLSYAWKSLLQHQTLVEKNHPILVWKYPAFFTQNTTRVRDEHSMTKDFEICIYKLSLVSGAL